MELGKNIRAVYEADIDSKNCVSCVKFEDFKSGRKTECCHKCVMEKDVNRFGWEKYPNLKIVK